MLAISCSEKQNKKYKIESHLSNNGRSTFAENTNGARARSGGLTRCFTNAIGANACIISIFSLYSGRSLAITKNAAVPWLCPIKCNFGAFVCNKM